MTKVSETHHVTKAGVIKRNPSKHVLVGAENWPDTFYRGHNLFEIYVNDSKIYNALELDTSWKETIHDDYGYPYEETVKREGQESYLGYVPSQDLFISGYDMWEGEENPAGIVLFKIDAGGNISITKADIDYGSSMMYGKRGALPKLHNKYPDLVDIRLD